MKLINRLPKIQAQFASLFIALSLGGCSTLTEQPSSSPHPKVENINFVKNAPPLSCHARPHPSIKKSVSKAYLEGRLLAEKAVSVPFSDPEGAWDKQAIANDPLLVKALKEYTAFQRGKQALKLDLNGKTLEQIDTELTVLGFYKEIRPIAANYWQSPTTYWREDGKTTKDKKDAQLIPYIFYAHPDGTVFKFKPRGIPDPDRKTFHPEPQYSKTVVKKMPQNCGKNGHHCKFDLSYENEAFKISPNTGMPLPKGAKESMRQLAEKNSSQDLKEKQDGFVDRIMEEVHVPLPASFSHCPVE